MPNKRPTQSTVVGGEVQHNPRISTSGVRRGGSSWYNMLKYNDFIHYFEKYNISKEDGITLLNYFEALALIGIEYLNNNDINDYKYD